MLKYCVVLVVLLTPGFCQTWGSRSCLVNPLGYYTSVMQAAIEELEVNWSNLKMDDFNLPINEELYNWHAIGEANFTNGFLISIQYVDLSNVLGSFVTRTVNDTRQEAVTIRGRVSMRLVKVGWDVDVVLSGFEPRRVTGAYTYTALAWDYTIERNLHTNVTTVYEVGSSSSGAGQMALMPASRMTEVVSRYFQPFLSGNSFPRWSREIIIPTILRKAEEIEFPEIRFNNDC